MQKTYRIFLSLACALAVLPQLPADAQFTHIPQQLSPPISELWHKARNLSAQENYKAALVCLNQLIEKAPNQWAAYLDRAAIKSTLGDDEGAERDWMSITQKCGDGYLVEMANCNIGSYFASKGDYAQALKHLDLAIKHNPRYSTARKMRAQILVSTNQVARGLEDYSALIATATGGDTQSYRFERARAYERVGKYTDAISDYTVILKGESDQDEAFYKRALCQSKINRLDLALKDINDAIKYGGTLSRYLDARADIYQKLGKADLAKTDRIKARSVNSTL